MIKLADKKTEKLCKEVDREGYYRYVKERDEKRFSWIKIFKKGKMKRIFYYVLHMTGIHTFNHRDSEIVTVDDCDIEIWTCSTCGYECTFKGILWEIVKFVLFFVGWIGFLFSPARNFMFPLLSNNIELLMLFFLVVHIGAGLRDFIELMCGA